MTAQKLPALAERHGERGMIVNDHGTELTPKAILKWGAEHKVDCHSVVRQAVAERLCCKLQGQKAGRIPE